MAHSEAVAPRSFASKTAMYDFLDEQFKNILFVKSKFSHSANLFTGLSNAAALLFYNLNALSDPVATLQDLPVNWVGFYLLAREDVLTLGPFQGKVACTEIRVGKGVCGTAVATRKSQLVADVHQFPGHIACDGGSNSEIVIPLRTADGSIAGVLDIDSTRLGHFDAEDMQRLEALAARLGALYSFPFILPSAHPPKDVVTKQVRVASIDVITTTHPVIASSGYRTELEQALGVLSLPEILFPHNKIVIANAVSGRRVTFDASSALARSRVGCLQQSSKDKLNGVSAAQSWCQSPFAVFDPKVDWAWRNDFDGVWQEQNGEPIAREHFLCSVPGEGFNWSLLRDQTIPLLLFDHVDLFEDDLHDGGISKMSAKIRVMPTALFLLCRHFVRVDGKGAAAREVRVFFEVGATEYLCMEVSDKVLLPEALATEAVQELMRRHGSEDEVIGHMATANVSSRRIKF